MRPRRSSVGALGPLALVLAVGLTGCPGGGAPTPPPGGRPAPAAAKPAAPPVVPPAPASEYVYETKGRRDPFRPLITPRVQTAAPKARPKTGLASLEVHELKVAGIVWERRGYYALVEAPNGAGYVLRVNDVIGEDARVRKITPEAVTVEVTSPTPMPVRPTPARLVELRLRKEE
ncbi:MAG: pilus assembly protein PilP [Candidatus Methylomirabilales bacterium]